MAKIETINKYTEVKQKTNKDIRNQGPIVGDSASSVSTTSQTYLDLAFSVTIANQSLFKIYVDGSLLSYTDDYSFGNIANGVSSRVVFSTPLSAGLNIYYEKMGVQKESFPNPSSVQAQLTQEVAEPLPWAQNGFTDSVQVVEYEVPYSSFANIDAIENRAKIKDYSNTLAPLMGIERIRINSASLINDEFGPNGESVYETDSKDSRIRFVGGNWQNQSSTQGTGVFLSGSGSTEYLEVTFYGTGLNLLILHDNATRPIYPTIDNGSEGASIYTAGSAILNGRNYNQNVVQPIESGLTLGWHTIKVRFDTTSESMYVFGCEILNESTQLKVAPGIGYNGCKRQELAALSSTDYNAGITGTKGARVVKYLKDGAISQVVQECPSTPSYVPSVDHSDEEIVRRFYYREFGKQRSDDFSTLSTVNSNFAFTLDDGTTTLVAKSVRITPASAAGTDTFFLDASDAFVTLTFVGTGVDLVEGPNTSSSGTDDHEIYVDGVHHGKVAQTNMTTAADHRQVQKLVSGLPYGTHTVKIINSQYSAGAPTIAGFIIYQPKKPTLPVDAVEICDYNVMADFVDVDMEGGSNENTEKISQGVLRKFCTREIQYDSGYNFDALNVAAMMGGWAVYVQSSSKVAKYSFFGTGIAIHGRRTSGYAAVTVDIDGSTDHSALTTVANGWGFVPSTGIVDTSNGASLNTYGNSVSIDGLELGLHTITVTTNSASTFEWTGFDVITPIHVNNTKVGSLALSDSRKFSPIPKSETEVDLGKAKALLVFDNINSKVLFSENISQVIDLATGQCIIYFEKPFKDNKYVMIGSSTCYGANNNNVSINQNSASQTKLPSKAHIMVRDDTNTYRDVSEVYVAFFGELQDE